MKNAILGCWAILGLAISAGAADLEAVITETTPGESTGAIDLDVTGGVAPFEFSWIGPDGFSATDEDLTDLAEGTYTVTVTDLYCGVAVLTVEVGAEVNVGIEEEDPGFELSVYPNPTEGLVYLNSNIPIDVTVYNILGEVIVRKKNVTKIDLSGNPSGIYLIQARSERGVLTRKITLQS